MILDDIILAKAFVSDVQAIYNIAYDASNRPEYRGVAIRGSDNSDKRWTIEKITYDANGLVTQARLSVPNSIWDNRASLSYA